MGLVLALKHMLKWFAVSVKVHFLHWTVYSVSANGTICTFKDNSMENGPDSDFRTPLPCFGKEDLWCTDLNHYYLMPHWTVSAADQTSHFVHTKGRTYLTWSKAGVNLHSLPDFNDANITGKPKMWLTNCFLSKDKYGLLSIIVGIYQMEKNSGTGGSNVLYLSCSKSAINPDFKCPS